MITAFHPIRSAFAAAVLLLALSTTQSTAVAAAGGKAVVYEGTVSVAVEDDFAHGRATRRYFLDERNLGQRFELQLTESQAQNLRTGARVRVRGVVAGGTVSADPGSDSVTITASAVAAAPVTARKALVMLVDITDSTGTVSAVSSTCDGSGKSADIMFGSTTGAQNVDGCYQDSSFGALGMGGATYPGSSLDVVRVSVTEAATTGGTCNYSAWGSSADKAAAAAGITPSNYQHRVYVLPSNAGCSWAGLAYVGCANSCQAWIKAYSGQVCGYSDAYAHELGHNLGMWHASTDTNNDGTLDCEYCDTSDFMGYALPNLRTQNGPHKVQMGWASGARVVDGSAGGTFTIAALESSAAAYPQVVKVRPTTGDPYYVSYRTATGYDQSMPSPTTYLNRTTVHRWASGNTRYIGSLGDGETFNDTVSGLSIRQLSHTSTSATFEVATSCVAQSPTVALSPASQGAGSVPATRSYTLTVSNRDSAACGPATFSLAGTVPAGWSGSVAPSVVTAGAGGTATATLSVTNPLSAAAGNYAVTAGTASDTTHPAVSASATFWIDTLAPNAPAGLKATVKASKVTLSWTAATDNGGSGVARYVVYRGANQAGTTASTNYTDAPGSGTWTYTVVAVDAAGNASGPSAAVTIKAGRK